MRRLFRIVITIFFVNLVFTTGVMPVKQLANANISNVSGSSLLDSAYSYLPLRVGNIWIYENIRVFYSFISTSKVEIVDSVLFDNHIYYKFNIRTNYVPPSGSCSYGTFFDLGDNFYLRIDSLTGNLIQYNLGNGCYMNNPNEVLIDSLASWKGDSVFNINCEYDGKINYTFYTFEFGQYRPSKRLTWLNYPQYWTRTYLKGIGVQRFSVGDGPLAACENRLKGCILNNIVYGDTSITGINYLSTEIPISFSLHQNYPNPFNPSTRIKFDVPKGSLVRLKVYDMLGREVAELVNEKLNAGVYEYEWSGVGLPSGVYFYKLEAGRFVETRRMVLVK